ncbi:glycoside hydrolase superfamily [Zychaea mexicana]|uniref:glycoside hydrolase superfamily n=1 Tax=Zychaea mexicana TaxID=64656 RepID=UPI0022FE671C|nr:glycoside hydrolase superfamily [Zychaea mexicana]KAI9493954.1 glycoside hydrolase superfamily [Zychaea mexicana]
MPDSIPWDKFDHVNYAFGVPDNSGNLGQFNEDQLKSVVKEAHDNNKTISLSVGGWTGSLYFSSLVRTDQSRRSFADILAQACQDYDLDGIDIDWEYPNSANGVSCNQNDPADTPNFLQLLQLLRVKLDSKFDKKKLLTAAVSTLVFNDAKQEPFSHLSPGWATALDAVQIMGYDLNGFWNNHTGPNSPLYYGGVNHEPSIDRAVRAWAKAGIPHDRIVVGVPFFGYTTRVSRAASQRVQYVTIDHSQPQIQADQYDSEEAEPCPDTDTKSFSGEMQWRSIDKTVLGDNSTAWDVYFDDITMTPYAYNAQQKQYLSFDNPQSLKAKIDYVKQYNLGGMMLWSLEMDDEQHTLLNALQDLYE